MKFVSMVTYRDYVLAITESGMLYKIIHNEARGGDVTIIRLCLIQE